jgi:hypothetical protein
MLLGICIDSYSWQFILLLTFGANQFYLFAPGLALRDGRGVKPVICLTIGRLCLSEQRVALPM